MQSSDATASRNWSSDSLPNLAGRRFYITGANSGIGYYAALELARHGGTVVLACRDQGKAQAALRRLQAEATGPQSAAGLAETAELNLASLASIQRAAERELAAGKPLHCLINNAGVYAPATRRTTEDGFELQWGTNVLGHFALTARLFPLLQQDAAARVVTIASIAHKRAKLNFADLNAERSYSPQSTYGRSKLGDLVFALELARRLREAESPIRSVAAHPGVANTSLFLQPEHTGFERWARAFVGRIIDRLLNSEAGGALPTVFAAAAPEAQSGGYYGPQGLFEARGNNVGPARIAPQAQDAEAGRKLWAVCEESTGLRLIPSAQ